MNFSLAGRILGNSIDLSLYRLKAGNTGGISSYRGTDMPNNQKRYILNTYTRCIGSIAIAIAGIVAMVQRGFFFAEDLYLFAAVWFILWPILVLMMLLSDEAEAISFNLRGILKISANRAAIIMLSCPFLMVVLYALSWMRGSVSPQGTLNEILRWSLYGTFAVLAFLSTRSKGSAWLIHAAWHAMGMVISLSALLSVNEGLNLPYFIAYNTNPSISVTGARLGGFLQYPNTFGAVMAVFLLERLFAVSEYYAKNTGGQGVKRRAVEESGADRRDIESSGVGRRDAGSSGVGRRDAGSSGVGWRDAGSSGAERRDAGKGAALLRMLPLFPYAAALLLSESRGAWLAAACACAAALLWKRRLLAPLLAAGAAPVTGAALLYRQLAAARLAVELLPGLLALAGLWAGALLAGLWLCRRQRSLAGARHAAVLGLAALGWTAGAVAVLLHVQARITQPSSTVSARALFYRDAWRLATDAPWLGRGGETWRNVYLAAQSHPYVGSQVHSGYLDILLNLGIVGLVVALVMLIAMCRWMAVSSPRLLPPFLVIAMHGAVDFDWCFGLIWILLFWLAALAVTDAWETLPTQVIESHIIHSEKGPLSIRASSKIVVASVVCCASLVLCLISWRAQSADLLYRKAMSLFDSTERVSLLQQSVSLNPLSPRSVAVLSKELPHDLSKELLLHSLMDSPENPDLNWNMTEVMMHEDKVGDALYWARRSLRLDVYNFKKRTKAIQTMLLLGERRLAAGDKVGALHSASSGLELLREYKLLAGGAACMEYNDRSFHLTEQAINLGQRLKYLMLRVSTG